MRQSACCEQAGSKEGGRSARRVVSDYRLAGWRARRAGSEQSNNFGRKCRGRRGKQNGGRSEVEKEVGVRQRRDVRLGFDPLDADGRRAALGVSGMNGRGRSAHAARARPGPVASLLCRATGARSRGVGRNRTLLHGTAGGTRVAIQALPGRLCRHRHHGEGHGQQQGSPPSIVKR